MDRLCIWLKDKAILVGSTHIFAWKNWKKKLYQDDIKTRDLFYVNF